MRVSGSFSLQACNRRNSSYRVLNCCLRRLRRPRISRSRKSSGLRRRLLTLGPPLCLDNYDHSYLREGPRRARRAGPRLPSFRSKTLPRPDGARGDRSGPLFRAAGRRPALGCARSARAHGRYLQPLRLRLPRRRRARSYAWRILQCFVQARLPSHCRKDQETTPASKTSHRASPAAHYRARGRPRRRCGLQACGAQFPGSGIIQGWAAGGCAPAPGAGPFQGRRKRLQFLFQFPGFCPSPLPPRLHVFNGHDDDGALCALRGARGDQLRGNLAVLYRPVRAMLLELRDAELSAILNTAARSR